jgi:tetrahydromethanopterin S-methyltransferase subunit G
MANDNLVLEHLKHIRGRVDHISEDVTELKHRLVAIERGQAKGLREYADLYGDQARQQASMDRINERLDRIERRLELADE